MSTIIIDKNRANELDFLALQWTLLSRSKDKARANLRGVYSDDGFLVSTDGHRLHLCTTDLEIPNGNYEVVSSTAKTIVLKQINEDFPNWERVIPTWIPSVSCNGGPALFYRAVYREFAGNCSFEPTYLNDAYVSDCVISLSHGKSSKSPLLVYDNWARAAVIMPMKL